MSYGYTLNFGLVTDAASRSFLVLTRHLATPCHRRCIARFPSVSMSFGYTLSPTLHRVVSQCKRVIWLHLVTDPTLHHLATACYRRCIAWFPSFSMSYGYTLNFGLVTDAASRGFLVLTCYACHLAAPCHRRCIACFPSVSMSFGYTLLPTLHRAVSQC